MGERKTISCKTWKKIAKKKRDRDEAIGNSRHSKPKNHRRKGGNRDSVRRGRNNKNSGKWRGKNNKDGKNFKKRDNQ